MLSKRSLLSATLGISLSLCATVGWSMKPITSVVAGAPVKQVSEVSRMIGWQAIDTHHLVIDLKGANSYLLTLSRACVALPRADHVGISASNNTVYAGFDYITADGERCAIKSIAVLSQVERQALIKV